jgi:hypothetical protein
MGVDGHGIELRISVERCARGLLRRAGYSDDETPGPVRIAHGLGLTVLEVPADEVRGDGEVQGDTLLVRWGLSRERFNWSIVHEVMEHHAYEVGHRFAHYLDKERWCDAGAAALLAPWRAFRRDIHSFGPEFAALARSYGLSPTAAALRFGECTGTPVAVIAPLSVRVRGVPRAWGTIAEMRQAAAYGCTPSDLRRTRLCAERVVLLAA